MVKLCTHLVYLIVSKIISYIKKSHPSHKYIRILYVCLLSTFTKLVIATLIDRILLLPSQIFLITSLCNNITIKHNGALHKKCNDFLKIVYDLYLHFNINIQGNNL